MNNTTDSLPLSLEQRRHDALDVIHDVATNRNNYCVSGQQLAAAMYLLNWADAKIQAKEAEAILAASDTMTNGDKPNEPWAAAKPYLATELIRLHPAEAAKVILERGLLDTLLAAAKAARSAKKKTA